ncbi:M20/M25/M40 family metallo-hydrolase [Cytophagales bacterium RKSG123]|nr:M20/M25/M40 family metallo-hydrolase [Xanthovirga aplysinae]
MACQSTSKDEHKILSAINEEVINNSQAYATLEEASQTIGHRLTGSENGHKAEQYAHDLLQSYGFEDVTYQEFEVEAWSRKSVSLNLMNSNESKAIPAVSLAHSPIQAKVEGQLVDLGNGFPEDYKGKEEIIKGNIALVYIDILPDSPKSSHNLHRSEKTALAIKHGATGVVIINRVDGGVLLTGTASIDGGLISIPAVCIGKEEGMALKEALKKDKITAKIEMENVVEPIMARNVIATLKGSGLPEEKIVIGGHLDSWDLATGAIDNGIGSFAVLDMARTFKALDLKTKRTIEFVMFMGEEQGLLGSKVMVEKLKKDQKLGQVKYMMNVDMSGNPIGFNASGRKEAKVFFGKVGEKIRSIDTVFTNKNRNRAGLHSDHQPFMLEGIPVVGLVSNLDPKVYSCYHSDCDSFDLVDETHLENTVRFGSMMLYELANANNLPAQKLNHEANRDFLIENGLKEKLVLGGEWKWGE